ncbi:MAG: PQQ-binding-like beta-propeller repeat protein, partial [Dehalococcoidales bacterium]|nr:PQQ-binding-like beta-propeller repeat protein [Dehalococcoidales bacterium]
LIPLSIAFLGLYTFTDVMARPSQGINSDSAPGEWAMFRHDLSRSGSNDPGGPLPQGTLKWVFSTPAPIDSSPVVADGTVYVGSRDFKFYAVDTATGTKRWEYQTSGWVTSSAAVVNGVAYFGSNDGRLYALNADSGEKLWDFKTQYAISSSPAVAGGIVYFGADDFHIYALDAATGIKLWDFEAEAPIVSSPVVANGILYVGSSDFGYALNALTGKPRLRFKAYYTVVSSPAVLNEVIYFTNSYGYLFALNGNARNWPRENELTPYWLQLWFMGIPGVPFPPPQSGFLWGLIVDRAVISSPVVMNDTIYTSSNNKLFAIDLQKQEKRWEFETTATIGSLGSPPAVLNTTLYIASKDGWLLALDTASGAKLWDIPVGEGSTSSPTVADGTIYIGSLDGNLYAIK